MRGRIFRHFFEDLMEGDPVALTVVGVLAVFLLIIGFVAIKAKIESMNDENRRRKKSRR
jgi:hypothetical protein